MNLKSEAVNIGDIHMLNFGFHISLIVIDLGMVWVCVSLVLDHINCIKQMIQVINK